MLFCCACCRRVWDQMASAISRRGVESAERLADRPLLGLPGHVWWHLATTRSLGLGPADVAAAWTTRGPHWLTIPSWVGVACKVSGDAASAAAEDHGEGPARAAAYADERCAQAALLRDVFASPRCRALPPLPPALRGWNGGLIPKLARAAYEERALPGGALDPGRLAVLADALEDAGCTEAELLRHLREPAGHVRGCWAVDLALGLP
jgi:hypothetical protein